MQLEIGKAYIDSTDHMICIIRYDEETECYIDESGFHWQADGSELGNIYGKGYWLVSEATDDEMAVHDANLLNSPRVLRALARTIRRAQDIREDSYDHESEAYTKDHTQSVSKALGFDDNKLSQNMSTDNCGDSMAYPIYLLNSCLRNYIQLWTDDVLGKSKN